MDAKEIEEILVPIIKNINNAISIFYVRDALGIFPFKIRTSVFFSNNNTPLVVEVETNSLSDEVMEECYQTHIKRLAIDEANDIINGKEK